jgi:serine/threonine protein kinase
MEGRTLSHFRILAKIGEGGIGVVYKAEDEQLRRAVALKVLLPDVVANEDRRARFLREARAAAAISHPNIATIYEVGEADGVVFIAMELVPGTTLRGRVALGALAQVYERLGDNARARRLYDQFIADWKDGDPDIPELVTARQRLAMLSSRGTSSVSQ